MSDPASAPTPGALPAPRFERQARFAPLGPAGQVRLSERRVLIVGCGALGGVLAQWLTRAGVGELVLVDRDVVEETNLPRQVLFSEEHAAAGSPKVTAAAETLASIGGPTRIEPHAVHLDADQLLELGAGVDLILDGTDNMATRYLVNDYAVREGVPWIYAGVVSSGGLVLSVQPGEGPCLRCVFPDPPPPGALPTCDTAGVLGPAVGAIASMQAGLALRQLSGAEPASPALIDLDVWSGSARRLSVPRAPACPCCAERRFEFLEGATADDAVSLCGRNTVQVLPPPGAPAPAAELVAANLRSAGIEVLQAGPLLRFTADGNRVTLFPDGRALVEGTEDTSKARAVVARWVGA